MSSSSNPDSFRQNLWAPWRIEYLRRLDDESDRPEGYCFICDYRDRPSDDRDNLVLWRTEHSLVVFNGYPYTNGHLLICPLAHIGKLEDLSDRQMLELMQLSRDAKRLLSEAISPHGFNLGVNLGRCAGAGLPGHLHVHLVPRWNGDTNFMSVLTDVRVISQSLHALYDELIELSKKLELPMNR